MASLNRIILVGKLVSDPDAKFTVEGVPVTRFKLAVGRFQKEGAPPATDIIDVVTWRKLAEVCGQHLKKGRSALIEGRIQIRSFDDQGGQRKWVTEVIGRNVQVLGEGAVEAGHAVPSNAVADDIEPSSFTEEVAELEDDLPF